MASFLQDNAAYEKWLASRCDVVKRDLAHKHERMEESPFIFLRATYFRWAKQIVGLCPEFAGSPRVLTVGDIHVENYGVWRDREGRLVWGVNDFDEAARLPCGFDLVRLSVSAMLSPEIKLDAPRIAACILDGYKQGLAAPEAIILDRDQIWMRDLVICDEAHRRAFWSDLDALESIDPPLAAHEALTEELPRRAEIVRFTRRRKGGGSLGKPRFVLMARWRGGDLVREAKAFTPSAWNWAHGDADTPSQFMDLVRGASRSPDPHLDVRRGYIVRRLAPDNRKIEFDGQHYALTEKVLSMMGRDLGAIHGAQKADAISAFLLQGDFLLQLQRATQAAAAQVEADYKAWLSRKETNGKKR